MPYHNYEQHLMGSAEIIPKGSFEVGSMQSFKLIYKDPDVKGILINIFGGMMRCNDIAQGLVDASKEVGLDKPLVVRLEGTNVEMGMDILKNSGFPIKPVETMEQAAQDIVNLVKEKK